MPSIKVLPVYLSLWFREICLRLSLVFLSLQEIFWQIIFQSQLIFPSLVCKLYQFCGKFIQLLPKKAKNRSKAVQFVQLRNPSAIFIEINRVQAAILLRACDLIKKVKTVDNLLKIVKNTVTILGSGVTYTKGLFAHSRLCGVVQTRVGSAQGD